MDKPEVVAPAFASQDATGGSKASVVLGEQFQGFRNGLTLLGVTSCENIVRSVHRYGLQTAGSKLQVKLRRPR